MASCTAASARSRSTTARVLGYAKVNYTQNALKINFFTNILNGSATNLLAIDPTGHQLQFDFKQQDVRFRGRQRPGDREVERAHVRRQPAPERLRSHHRAAGRQQNRRRCVRAGRALPREVLPRDSRRTSRQVRQHLGRPVLASDEPDVQAVQGSDIPGVVQPGVPRAVGHQQLSRYGHPQSAASDAIRGVQSRAQRTGVHVPSESRGRPRGRAWRDAAGADRDVHYRVRSGLHGHHQAARYRDGGVVRQRDERRRLLHAGGVVPGDESAARLAAAAVRARAAVLPAETRPPAEPVRLVPATVCRRPSAIAILARCDRRGSSSAWTARSARH